MKNILVCVLVVFSLATVVRAEANRQIVGITVTGAGRTSHAVILSALGISPGDRVSDRADFERRCVAGLYRMRVFGKAQARLVEREDGLELQLTVEEKWTLLPVPFVAVYQKKLTLGAGVLESNFLGTLNSVGGFFFLQDGTPGFFGFSHWALDASRAWSLSFSPQWMGRGVDLWDGQTKTGEYDERIGAVSFGISRKFSPAWELGVRLDAVWYRLGDGPFEGGYEGLPLALTLGYNGQQAVEDHIRGFQWKLALSADTGWFGTDLARTSASLQWSLALPIGPGGYIMLEQAGAAADGLARGLEYRLGGRGSAAVRAVRGYHEDQFRTSAWLVTSLEWRLQVWSTRALVGSLFPFADHGLFREADHARQVFSAGLGFRIYLRRVLFPAFSIYLAWAADNREVMGGVSAGMRM